MIKEYFFLLICLLVDPIYYLVNFILRVAIFDTTREPDTNST
jgi:hypothetical protein